ncbi:ras family-domain-containing protein [Clohesyomyces aquaticus]|uniref:Ras family-domain-containing protein n=1 Tax=Clohesyomyces aquaticus TaxID=1231657 RepID=A0A1Y1YA29_9PLEO|nr:ras family-domain-containing protein [Clohesyomyces aquaticus]
MIRQFEFAADLESSRVYRKAQSPADDKSFRSSIALSHAWSALSDVSLSEISVITTVALPISLRDLANGHHYESKANVIAVVREEETTDWPLTTNPVSGLRADAIAKRRVRNGVLPREYKLVVVGGGGVDKSRLNIQVCVKNFEIEHGDPYDFDEKPICQIDDEIAVFDTLDTAGQEEYSAMREQYMRTGEGFLLVYSVTSRYSFEDIITFHQQILRVKDKDYFPMTIVGNHCLRESERQVSFEEGVILARNLGVSFVEVDTSQAHNIATAFFDIVRKIRKYEEDLIVEELESAREAKARRELEKFKENMKSKPRSRWLRKTRDSSSLGPIMQGF